MITITKDSRIKKLGLSWYYQLNRKQVRAVYALTRYMQQYDLAEYHPIPYTRYDAMNPSPYKDTNPYLYFLINESGKVVYVGQTRRIKKRLYEHSREKEFTHAIAYKANSLAYAIGTEILLIQHFSPALNKQLHKV